MTFKKRTSLSTLSDSKWMEWAIHRTGVPMPNCVTYATARISEILNQMCIRDRWYTATAETCPGW